MDHDLVTKVPVVCRPIEMQLRPQQPSFIHTHVCVYRYRSTGGRQPRCSLGAAYSASWAVGVAIHTLHSHQKKGNWRKATPNSE